jgi:cytidylate kinase
MSVIAISQELGTGGDRIGQAVAKRLGYEYADREILLAAANRYGVPETDLARLDEARPTLWERVRGGNREYLAAITATVWEFAARDKVVIIGRGSPIILRGPSHVLRVRIAGPPGVRADRLVASGAATRENALAIVQASDRERAARMRFLFDTDWSAPTVYDLTINAEHWDEAGATELIAWASQQPQFASTPQAAQRAADEALAARVRAALLFDPRTRSLGIGVLASRGSVTISGAVQRFEARRDAEAVAAAVEGVSRVSNEILVQVPSRAA